MKLKKKSALEAGTTTEAEAHSDFAVKYHTIYNNFNKLLFVEEGTPLPSNSHITEVTLTKGIPLPKLSPILWIFYILYIKCKKIIST